MHFLQFGSGPALILAFPGYGMTAASFHFLAQEGFTVLSFDLPHSGRTECATDFEFTKEQLALMIEELLLQKGLKRLSLAGFSIGGRICLSAVEAAPDLIASVVVAAPDGTGKEWFYWFVTGTTPGRKLFERFVQHGDRYIRVLHMLHFIRLLPGIKFRFIMQYIGTREARAKVRHIWMSLAKLIPNCRQVATLAGSKKIPIHILAGNRDTIIPLRHLRRFAARSSYISLHLFERGHNLLQFDEVRGMFAARLRKS